MDVGLERAHAGLLNQGKGLLVVSSGRLDAGRQVLGVDVPQEPQGMRLVPTFLVRTSQRPVSEGVRLLQTAGRSCASPRTRPRRTCYQFRVYNESMPKRLSIQSHLTLDALERRYRTAKDPVAHSHWQMVWLLAQGLPSTQVAAATGYSANGLRTIAQRYN
jgi:hypothetical protein